MRQNRQAAFDFTMKEEGAKFTNDPDDRGGPTKMGLTIGLMRKLGMDLNHDGQVNEDDVRLVTREDAERVFIENFWIAIDADNLPPGIDLIAADIAFNSGPAKWHQFQREGFGTDIDKLVKRRKQFYSWQARNVSGQMKYYGGWLKRAEASGEAAKGLLEHTEVHS